MGDLWYSLRVIIGLIIGIIGVSFCDRFLGLSLISGLRENSGVDFRVKSARRRV